MSLHRLWWVVSCLCVGVIFDYAISLSVTRLQQLFKSHSATCIFYDF